MSHLKSYKTGKKTFHLILLREQFKLVDEKMARLTLSLLIFVLIANSALSELVQHLRGNNIILEPTAGNRYHLIIHHSDGTLLELFVRKTDIGKYEVKGRLEQPTYIRYGQHNGRSDSSASPQLDRVPISEPLEIKSA